MEFKVERPDGSTVRVTHWYHTQGTCTREVKILNEGTGDYAGMSYVKSLSLPWEYRGYRGFRTSYCQWVPDSELWFVTDEEALEGEPFMRAGFFGGYPSCQSTTYLDQLKKEQK